MESSDGHSTSNSEAVAAAGCASNTNDDDDAEDELSTLGHEATSKEVDDTTFVATEDEAKGSNVEEEIDALSYIERGGCSKLDSFPFKRLRRANLCSTIELTALEGGGAVRRGGTA